MKTAFQIGACSFALAALLTGPASSATNIADLPLKTSVLAKPNVIFAMDDSGSMDWEVLLDTSSGLFWWNGSTGWNSSTGKPVSTNNSYVPYAYLMPVGTATGGQIYAYNSSYGQAVPPTPQFAWLRSKHFNPIYYDSNTTYKPWAPAYVSGATKSFSNASASAALSHPLYSTGPKLALNTQWDSGNSKFSNNGYMFYMQAGMKVPVGAYVPAERSNRDVCSGSTWRTLTAELTVPSGSTCWAAIPYYPATFWHAEDCTVDGTSCITGPDGTTKLKKYEIKSGNTFPSGRTYDAEMQNFANWFSYYRKRKLMLGGSMGQVLESLTGLRLGVVPFNANNTVTMYDTDGTSASSNAMRVMGQFYGNAMSAEGTPTHATVKYIGGEYNTNTSIIQYACQRNNTFVVTDGFSNTTSISVPTYDSSTYGGSAPYTTIPTGSLADLALYQYTKRLRTDLTAGRVSASTSTEANADRNPDLHINTYAISLGVRGSLWPNTEDPFVTAPTWTTPTADNPSMIDDQWHATINGRGKMFLASSPTETATSIKAILDDIIFQVGAQSAVAVSTVNLTRGDGFAYLGTYNPSGWSGDLTANAIDSSTGDISATATWSAAMLLAARNYTTRQIATDGGSGGVAFTSTNVGSLVDPSSSYGDGAALFNYLRGDRSLEGTTYRRRTSLIGAVINAEPVISNPDSVAYLASSEGMLHAIDIASGTDRGQELWAFVPHAALSTIGAASQRGYNFGTHLDGTPVIGKTGSASKLLVAGMGAAGRAYYALDVSTPRTNTESNAASWVKWRFPGASTSSYASKVGQTLGKPVIVKVADDTYRVLVTSGYNATADGYGRLFVLDPADGSVLKEYVTTAGSADAEAGLAHVSGYLEQDNTVRYVYGGDLLGNVWRFDLSLEPNADGAVHKVATLLRSNGDAQPVTAAPELARIGTQRVVLVGTGRLLDVDDFGRPAVQTFYAIADGATITAPRSTLVQRTYTRSGTNGTISGDDLDWTTQRGWYLDLPAGEQANTEPAIAYGAIAFTTNVIGATDCSASSWMYVLDFKTGKVYEHAAFVSTQISSVATSSGVRAVLTDTGDMRGLIQTGDGQSQNKLIGSNPPIPAAKNSWREIRRQ
ncbi:pyrrolo-quinoline quinone [Rubrivivax sp. JA1029]|uniref:pilus assembly protein n=1 Tax=Rubrivivax sp. JA1029 TaxID=2894193 RepID=UPI001E382F36|nr:PilC/PilY family type IV pilus protein [Rubrivivax sp. JA1029]MCC9648648.1 pyrrolo-quinoline quinone [Rubrivivax sp. JA1029]